MNEQLPEKSKILELDLVPTLVPELVLVPQSEFAPVLRHINRYRRGFSWLGPAIEKPQ